MSWQQYLDVHELLKLIPRPLFVVRTRCLHYILFRHDAAVGLVKVDIVPRETVKAMGYTVFDLNRPDSARERESMLERADELYRPLYAATLPPAHEKSADNTLVIQASDDDFVLFKRDGDEITAGAITAEAASAWTTFDVRRPRSKDEWQERHARWCSAGGAYVLVFHRQDEIQSD